MYSVHTNCILINLCVPSGSYQLCDVHCNSRLVFALLLLSLLLLSIVLVLLVDERLQFVVETLTTVAVLPAVGTGQRFQAPLIEVFLVELECTSNTQWTEYEKQAGQYSYHHSLDLNCFSVTRAFSW